ncbi:MAG: hypothetical protein AAGA03_09450 [Planctomycetota bacterium]
MMSDQTPWLRTEKLNIKLGTFSDGPATALADTSLLVKVQDYRRQASARMQPIEGCEIQERIPASTYHVSRKVDGEFAVLVYRDQTAVLLNPGGRVRSGLPCSEAAASKLRQAGVKTAMLAVELYALHPDRRPRVHDVVKIARQPESEADLDRLQLAVFDIIEIDDQTVSDPFAETWKRIESWFGDGPSVHPVEAVWCSQTSEIAGKFETWVQSEDAEGLVVRSDDVGTFKIKPRHTIDAVVIGFTESTGDRQGLLHDLLLAVARDDGTLHVLCRVGGGFSDADRRDLLSDLKDITCSSDYAEVNGDHVAYQMVRPEMVVEISCLDLVSLNTRGLPMSRMVLDFDADASLFRIVRRLPLVSVISPQFLRVREDKSSMADQIPIRQVADRVDVQRCEISARKMVAPPAQMLRRSVYAKQWRGHTMIRKFVTIQTNKAEDSDEYPPYVLHYTDYSPGRKIPLAREVRISTSRQQVDQLCEQMIEENIKKGWELQSTQVSEPVVVMSAASAVDTPSEAGAKSGAKKKLAAKKSASKSPAETATRKKKKSASVSRKKSASSKPRKKSPKKKSG